MRSRRIKKQIWLNDEEEYIMKCKSQAVGMNASDYIRHLIVGYKPKEKPSEQFYEEIKNIRKFCNDYGMKRKNGITKNEKMRVCFIRLSKSVWQGHKDSNPGHVVLETTALPTELYPYKICISMDRP